MKFFNPTSQYKELLLLEHIEEKPQTSQHEIARKIGTAASMVNNYMDRLEGKNYLIRDYKSSKVVHYNITSEGRKRKKYLSINYMQELLELYRLAESNMETTLKKLEDKGYQKILIYGAGEAAETILRIIRDRKGGLLEVVAIVDDSTEKKDKDLLGYSIISKSDIKDYEHDGVLITSYTYEKDISKKLDEIGYPKDRIEKFFEESIR